MRFTQAFLAALSAAAAQAVIITNADFSSISVGVPFVITYSDAVGPVTVYLGTGSPANVIQGDALGSSTGASGSITWTPTSGGSYALKIIDSGAATSPTNPNFSGFFNVAGAVVSSSSATTSSMMSTTVGASSTTMSTSMTTMSALVNSTTSSYSMSSTVAPINGTTISKSIIGTGSMTASSSSTSNPTQIPSSMAAGFASPLAFVFLAVGALLTLN